MLWRAYTPRFDLEHTFRFCKQRLNWETPCLRHPEQADRWTLLVLLAFTQLRLAQPVVTDARLSWQRPQERGRLTPSRVRHGFIQLLVPLGSPACAPKPSGRSLGQPKGKVFQARTSLSRLEKERLTTFDPTTGDRDKRGRLKLRAQRLRTERRAIGFRNGRATGAKRTLDSRGARISCAACAAQRGSPTTIQPSDLRRHSLSPPVGPTLASVTGGLGARKRTNL